MASPHKGSVPAMPPPCLQLACTARPPNPKAYSTLPTLKAHKNHLVKPTRSHEHIKLSYLETAAWGPHLSHAAHAAHAEPSTWVPLSRGAQCVVFAGDPAQLPPTGAVLLLDPRLLIISQNGVAKVW